MHTDIFTSNDSYCAIHYALCHDLLHAAPSKQRMVSLCKASYVDLGGETQSRPACLSIGAAPHAAVGMGATNISLLVPPKYGVHAGLGLLPHRSISLACSELTACGF